MNQRGFGLEDSVKVRSVSSLAIGPTILRFCFGSYAWHHGIDVADTFSTYNYMHNWGRTLHSFDKGKRDPWD